MNSNSAQLDLGAFVKSVAVVGALGVAATVLVWNKRGGCERDHPADDEGGDYTPVDDGGQDDGPVHDGEADEALVSDNVLASSTQPQFHLSSVRAAAGAALAAAGAAVSGDQCPYISPSMRAHKGYDPKLLHARNSALNNDAVLESSVGGAAGEIHGRPLVPAIAPPLVKAATGAQMRPEGRDPAIYAIRDAPERFATNVYTYARFTEEKSGMPSTDDVAVPTMINVLEGFQ